MTPEIGKEYYIKVECLSDGSIEDIKVKALLSDGTVVAENGYRFDPNQLIEIQDGTWQEGYNAAKEFYEEVLGASKEKPKVQKCDYMSANIRASVSIVAALAVGYELDFIAGDFIYLKRPINE
jgi:hypothetical protein